MKTVDYINTLIKEKEELKALCKSHVETIRTMKREISKLNNDIFFNFQLSTFNFFLYLCTLLSDSINQTSRRN